MQDQNEKTAVGDDSAPEELIRVGNRRKELPPAALRALQEAEERRREQSDESDRPREVGGRGGKDPARYGDWEIAGRAIDF